jgi:hypothetical protein
MQERVLHIKLVDRPETGDNQRKYLADGGRLDHRAEGLIIVDIGLLGEALKDPTSPVPPSVLSEFNLCLKIYLPVTKLEPT